MADLAHLTPTVGSAALFSAAGNRFAVLDSFEREPVAPDALAIRWSAELGLDGLLVAAAPRAGGACRMQVFNRDGSRAEACGNGLRCIALFAVERHGAADALVIETDAGTRRVEVLRRKGTIVGARAEMGVPIVVERDARIAVGETPVEATLVDMGNPHCVVFVADVERADVARLGPALERHERFPQRSNVSFAELAGPAELHVRTWERGVGETAACGTGVSAAAVAAIVRGRARSPVDVKAHGGRLEVRWDGAGPLHLAGPVEHWAR